MNAADGLASLTHSRAWNVLIVDDDPDIHSISRLALKRRTWRGRPFVLWDAGSAEEAKKILAEHAPLHFHAALVDVVMETDHAGLELCAFIRQNYPRSLRIVLRTGQPGLAPEESVLAEYDIDHYVAKSEATDEAIYSVLRASARASQDLATQIVLQEQMHALVRHLRGPATLEGLAACFHQSLEFLEGVHQARIFFNPELGIGDDVVSTLHHQSDLDSPRIVALMRSARERGVAIGEPVNDPRLGLRPNEHVLLFPIGLGDEKPPEADAPTPRTIRAHLRRLFGGTATAARANPDRTEGLTGIYFSFDESEPTERQVLALSFDLALFLGNWKIAYATHRVQERVAQERARLIYAQTYSYGGS
jgi:CheY-like chemotaxis protein